MALIVAAFSRAIAQPNPNLISLEHTTCYGSCPAYLLQIDSSGAVSFRQGPLSNRHEEQKSTITPDQFHDLVAEFAKLHLFELDDFYGPTHTDGPKTYIGLTLNGKAKTIAHFDIAPSGLEELERMIERTVNIHRWLHGDTRRFTLQSPVSGPQMGVGEDLKNELFVWQDVYAGIKPGMNQLIHAAGLGNVAEINRAPQRGEDMNAADETGWTALMVAAAAVQQQAVSAILVAGARVDQRDQHGDTALIGVAAVRFRNLQKAAEIVAILLAHGASVSATNDLGESALMWAARAGNAESIKVLLRAGADPAQVDQAGHNALFYLRKARDGLTFEKTAVEHYDIAESVLNQK